MKNANQALCYEKGASGNAFLPKETFRAPISRQVKTMKVVKETVKVSPPELKRGLGFNDLNILVYTQRAQNRNSLLEAKLKGFVWKIILRLIKRLKCTKTAIKVYIRHKKLRLCCLLTVSCPIKAILASFNVLVSQLQSISDNSNLRGKSKKGSSYREFELSRSRRK